MTDLVIRVYDVRFGDAVLVTIPDKEAGKAVERTILFDFGNALGTEGGQDDVLEAVIDDIIARLKGKPLDLYVMTHEHLDHVQGMLHASENLHKAIRARQVWLTGSRTSSWPPSVPSALPKSNRMFRSTALPASLSGIVTRTASPNRTS